MDFGQAVQTCLAKYADFNGRASRSEYWWFALFCIVVNIVMSFIDRQTGMGVLSILVSVALLLPALAVGARRLHDRDRSGWFLLLSLIPLVGSIILLIWFCYRGIAGPNRFGPDPLAASG
ncbi:MAG TPA: DUF805 domain-containing protein [Acetobacteraceae bacterium]